MKVYIIATKVKQFNYYLKFSKPGDVQNFTVEGLKNNATHFQNEGYAEAVKDLIITDRELFIDTMEIAGELVNE